MTESEREREMKTPEDDMHLHRLVTCEQCEWSGKSGELIARGKLRCPKCDSDRIRYVVSDPPEEALEPFATFGTNPDGEDLTAGLMRDRICDWFGPSDFRRARAELARLRNEQPKRRVRPPTEHEMALVRMYDSPALTQGEGSEPVGAGSGEIVTWTVEQDEDSSVGATYICRKIGDRPEMQIARICGGSGEIEGYAEDLVEAANHAFPPPLPAGNADPRVREAFDQAARVAEEWDSGWGEDRNTKVARQTAIEIAGAIRALPSPQSQGLVEAAEWQPIETAPKDTEILARIAVHGDHGELDYHRHSVLIWPTKRSYWFDTAALRQLSREEKIIGWRPLCAFDRSA